MTDADQPGAWPTPPPAAPPPPPPPTGGTFAPMPPPPAPGWAPDRGPLDAVAGLAKALRIMFWVVVGANAVLLAAVVSRKSTWENFIDGSASLDDVDGADAFVAGAAGLVVLAQIAVVIVLCIWSIRAAKNANRLWSAQTSPGLAGGGWFIPVANFVVPFIQLRKAFRAAKLATAAVSTWQAALIAQAVLGIGGRTTGNVETARNPDDVSGRLTSQVVFFALATVISVATAFFAARSVTELSKAEDAASA